MPKILYIWDLSGTIFLEKWNAGKSGFPDFESFVRSLDYHPETISPKDWEWAYQRPYLEEFFDVNLAPGFEEVLGKTGNNIGFTTGCREQISWRAGQLQRKREVDPRKFLKEVISTLDFGNFNIKNQKMFDQIVELEYQQGNREMVYSDDKLQNCELFLAACKKYPDLVARVYQIQHSSGFDLYQFWEKEKRFHESNYAHHTMKPD